MSGRSSELLKQQRLRRVLDMIAMGYSRFDMVEKLCEEWKVIPRVVDAYIRRAKDIISKEIGSQDASDTLNKLDYLYHLSIVDGDKRLAAQVQAIKAKYTLAQKQEITINDYSTKFPNLDEDDKSN